VIVRFLKEIGLLLMQGRLQTFLSLKLKLKSPKGITTNQREKLISRQEVDL
jgi:hypothetical protein